MHWLDGIVVEYDRKWEISVEFVFIASFVLDQVVRDVPEKTTAFYSDSWIPHTTAIYFLIWFYSLSFWPEF